MSRRTVPRRFGRRYIVAVLNRLLPFAAAVGIGLAGLGGPRAQSVDATRAANALRDLARVQERQADELRRLRQIEGDRARQDDRDRRDAAIMSRSARRFDRP